MNLEYWADRRYFSSLDGTVAKIPNNQPIKVLKSQIDTTLLPGALWATIWYYRSIGPNRDLFGSLFRILEKS